MVAYHHATLVVWTSSYLVYSNSGKHKPLLLRARSANATAQEHRVEPDYRCCIWLAVCRGIRRSRNVDCKIDQRLVCAHLSSKNPPESIKDGRRPIEAIMTTRDIVLVEPGVLTQGPIHALDLYDDRSR